MLNICIRRTSPRLPYSSISKSQSTSANKREIVIHQRIERGPTELLEALASTVGTDYTAPHYRYHDDPWLIPYKNNTKKDFTLSKEAGKKAAKYILNKHPNLFEQNRIVAEPPITAFQPRAAYNRDNVTIELLDNLVSSFQVQDSMEVFNLLVEKGKEVPVELRQDLLELVAFHNENEAEEEGFESRGMVRDQEKWKAGGFVEQMYSEGGEATAGERIAMLLGMGKHGGKTAFQMYEECKANKDFLPVEAYNVVINRFNKKDGVAKTLGFVKEVLTDMKEAGVAPTVGTLVSVLEAIGYHARSTEYDFTCKYALDVLAEFRLLEVEFSLAVYKVLLDIFVDKRTSNRSPILAGILKEVEGKDLSVAQHNQDLWFFPRAMQVCNQQNNAKLAWRVNELLHTGENIRLLSDFQIGNTYYQNFLSVVLQNDDFTVAMVLYNKMVPHASCPQYNYYQILLNHLHTNGALQHLGKVWDDILISDYAQANKENQYALTYQVMQILKSNDPALFDFTGLSEVWVDIARKVFNHLDDNKTSKSLYLRFNNLAPGICDLVLSVALREGNYELAARVVDFCRAEKSVMAKSLSDVIVAEFITASVTLGEVERTLEAVEYLVDMGSNQAVKIGLDVVSRCELRTDQKDYLNKVFFSHTDWVNI